LRFKAKAIISKSFQIAKQEMLIFQSGDSIQGLGFCLQAARLAFQLAGLLPGIRQG
jgi:hypothetical protein